MHRLVLTFLLSVSWAFFFNPLAEAKAQTTFPTTVGERCRYSVYIETPKAYVSGICVLHHDGHTVNGSIFNEFGLSVMDFSYSPESGRVKLHYVFKKLSKWYIRRILRKDLSRLMTNLQQGRTQYDDMKYKLHYTFTPISADASDDTQE